MNQMFRINLAMLIFGITASLSGQSHFTARFSAAQESHEVANDTAGGTAACILTAEGLHFYLSVRGLSGPIAAAHFHNGARGVSGPVVRSITNDFTGNTASGVWRSTDTEPLTDELIAALFAGDLYLNVHTAAYPAGEIRAQIIPGAGAVFSATLTEDQENHDVTAADPVATAILALTGEGLWYKITADDLTGPLAAAHFHNAPAGVDGAVVKTIGGDFDGNTASGVWRSSDPEPLTPERIADLFAGNLYLNIHTATNPAGEIRGQVNLFGGWGFTAALDTAQENHPVTNEAFGTAALTLTDAGLAYKLTVEGLSGPIAAAHFHNAAAGQDGPVVKTISGDFEGNTAVGLWTPNDAEPLTIELIQELLAGNLYLNVHTAANPGGEVRGQVLPDPGASFTARLTLEQEQNNISSDGSGTAYCSFTEAGLAFRLSVDGLTGPISAAHFHNGAMGKNGPVVRTITGEFSGNTAAGVWTATDAEPLTPELIRELFAGNLYFNVHTAANPGGEIRGQVLLSAGTPLAAGLTTAQETHVITQEGGSGTAAVNLTRAGVAYSLTINNLSGEVNAAHFHNGAVGINGGVVRTITDDFNDNFAYGIWRSSDTEPLTDALITALATGNLYLNVHTDANPAGEIRGQLDVSNGIGVAARLDAQQETHPVTSGGMGTASLTLTDAGLIFDMTVEGLSGPLAAAHFHNAPPNTAGPVVRTITNDIQNNTASGVWRSSDAEALTVELINELLGGNIYLNVHTAANPAGEIRGQLFVRDVITGVAPMDGSGQIPQHFSLRQNYPNPFNPSTVIEFSLSRSTHAELTIFNTVGQVVGTLVNAPLPAGRYEVTFDARQLASGLYFYQLKAGEFIQTRKMLLVR